MPFFSKVFKNRDGSVPSTKGKKSAHTVDAGTLQPQKPLWQDAWLQTEVEPEDIQELVRGCTQEMKSRALDLPFLLLPFRPNSDTTGARTFIRNFFGSATERGGQMTGEYLSQELRLTEPMVLCSIMKWCWSRLPGGVVTWEAYELFRVGEQDSNMARDSFATFIPLSVDSDARTKIIFDFFDLMAAIAAHGKTNGLGGRKLSRLAGWWAFEHKDNGEGFEGGYKSWASAADATSHLFFAYLRSLSPDSVRGTNGISALPISLQSLVQATEYPPETPSLMQTSTSKVVMIVDSVSPTPFALLRRAKHFEYRDDDPSLQAFASYDDPLQTLTEECLRVLNAISSTNQSTTSNPKGVQKKSDASWSRFEDMGFSGMLDDSDNEKESRNTGIGKRTRPFEGLSSTAHSKNDLGRPTTPSWADFLSSGFTEENGTMRPAPLLLPPDKILPPIDTDRVRSSQSHNRMADRESSLEPGELASITRFNIDECFWWVWITSLAGEEPTTRKAVFGRCALIETNIQGARWLVMEEKVKGAAPIPEEGAYIVEKKSRFGLSKRARMTRRKSTGKKTPAPDRNELYRNSPVPMSKTSIGPDQHARIQAAAAALQSKQRQQEHGEPAGARRARNEEDSKKTNSVLTLQPVIVNEASPAMKWAHKYDKDAIREAYLANTALGRGANGPDRANGDSNQSAPRSEREPSATERDLPAVPKEHPAPTPPREKEREHAALLSAQEPPPMHAHPAHGSSKNLVLDRPSAPRTPTDEKRLPVEISPPNVPQSEPHEPTSLEAQADAAALASTDTTPEKKMKSKPDSPGKKLKKRKDGGGGGFRKLFGKKKAGDIETNGIDRPQEPIEKIHQSSGINRTLSKLSKKKDANGLPSPGIRTPQHESQDAASVASKVSENRGPIPPPQPEIPSKHRVEAPRNVSAVDPREERDAAHAFSSFDQGPLDVPAFVPEDVSDGATTPHPPATAPPHAPVEHAPEPAKVQKSGPLKIHEPAPVRALQTEPVKEYQPEPVEEHQPVRANQQRPDPLPRGSGSGDSNDLQKTVSEQQDRWAQIRKNAAERAAARGSDEGLPRPSQGNRTEEGEPSGEETIESRVARIKARVAELTGNMPEGQSTA